MDLRDGEQRPPHFQPRNRIIGFRLGEHAGGVRNLGDAGEPAVVARPRPRFRLRGGLALICVLAAMSVAAFNTARARASCVVSSMRV